MSITLYTLLYLNYSGVAVALGSDFNPNAFCMSMVSGWIPHCLCVDDYNILLANGDESSLCYFTLDNA